MAADFRPHPWKGELMEPGQKLLFSRDEAAEMLSISVSTLDVAIVRGMLRARRQGRRVLVERREIERFARADHPRIWAPDGGRGISIAGRACFDCAASSQEYEFTPAVRFLGRLPLCQECFDVRKAQKGGGRERRGLTLPDVSGSSPELRSNNSVAARVAGGEQHRELGITSSPANGPAAVPELRARTA